MKDMSLKQGKDDLEYNQDTRKAHNAKDEATTGKETHTRTTTTSKDTGDFEVNLSESEEEEPRSNPHRKTTKTGGKCITTPTEQGDGKTKSTKKEDPTQRQGIIKKTEAKHQSTHHKEKGNECRIWMKLIMAATRARTEGEEDTGARPQPKGKIGAASVSQDEE